MKKRKINMMLTIILLLLFLGLGYAYLTTTLSINGTTNIDSNTWNIYLDNVNVLTGSVNVDTPVIDNTKTSVSYYVHLSKPGDYLEFTVDVVNGGSIDGMVDSVISTVNNQSIDNLPDYLEYRLTYYDYTEVESNHLLKVGSYDTYRVFIGYKIDIDPDDLPDNSQSINLSFKPDYIQASSNPTIRDDNYKYVLTDYHEIGEEVEINSYDGRSKEEIIEDFCHPFFIRVLIDNNIIKEKDIGFKLNNNYYYLKGSQMIYNPIYGAYGLDLSPYYESNKEVLQEAFGASNCVESTDDTYKKYTCNYAGLTAISSESGYVEIGDSDWYCPINDSGYSICTHQVGMGYNCYSG